MSFFRRLFGRPAEKKAALAMPIFPGTNKPDWNRILRTVRGYGAGAGLIGDFEHPPDDQGIVTARIPGGTLGVMHLPMPIPGDELTVPAAAAWHWPEAAEAARDHRAHAACFASSNELSMVELRLLHSQLVAAMVECGGASGVYVGSASLLRSVADDYLNDVRGATDGGLPVLSWVSFNPVAEHAGLSMYTLGLGDFGLRELEARQTRLDVMNLLILLGDLAHYELASGVEVGDRETFGGTATDRNRVEHTTSTFVDGIKVSLVHPAA